LLFSSTLHAQPDSLAHVSFARRWQYVRNLGNFLGHQQNKKISFDSLDKLIASSKQLNDPAFTFQLACLRYWSEGWVDMSNYKRELEFVRNGARKGYRYEAADAYHHISIWLWVMDLKTEAVETALSGYELYKHSSKEDFPPIVKYQHELATYYYRFQNYQRAKQLLLEIARPGYGSAYEVLGPFLNTLALIYREEKKYDSSIYYLKMLHEDKLNIIREPMEAIAAGNIGGIYNLCKQYDSAIKWTRYDLEYNLKSKTRHPPIFLNYVTLAEIYLKNNDIVSAKRCFDSATQVKSGVFQLKHLQYYHNVAARLYRALGKPAVALLYMDSLYEFTDSIHKNGDRSILLEAENRIANANNTAFVLRMENARNKSLWVRNFAIALLLFISVVGLLLVNRSRLRHKARELRLENEKNKAEAELGRFIFELSDRNQKLSQMEEDIRELSNEQDITLKNEIISELRQSTILTDEQWDTFRGLFEKVHGGYIQKVKDKYTELTPAEVRYVTLTKLGLNNKEMANILGISTNTVRNYKFRLRKKLGLSDEDDLDQAVKNI
jgi:DNA-binding CsgD family transcriptional regulator